MGKQWDTCHIVYICILYIRVCASMMCGNTVIRCVCVYNLIYDNIAGCVQKLKVLSYICSINQRIFDKPI